MKSACMRFSFAHSTRTDGTVCSDSNMDWREISRSRSRISMDWRPASRSRSRPPPPGQPFDQGNFSSSWSEGKFNFPPFNDATPLPGGLSGLSRSFDTSYISSSPSIPIPGIASQLRFGSPAISGSLPPQGHLAAVYEEGSGLPDSTILQPANGTPSGLSARLSQMDSLRQPISNLGSPSFQPNSLPASFFPGPSRHRLDMSDQNSDGRHVRRTSFDHTVGRAGMGRISLTGRLVIPDTSLVSLFLRLFSKRFAYVASAICRSTLR